MSGVAAVVLAAGFSRRLGRPKQTVVLNGEMLVERAVRVAMEAGLSPVVVVVGPEAEFLEALQERGCLIVVNEEASEGMAASIRRGVAAARMVQVSGVVVMACDQPGVRVEHLRVLVAVPERVTGSRYAGRTGVPTYFPASAFEALLGLTGDAGAREMLREAAFVEDEALALDVDTEADVEEARRLAEG
ncbi:nucleotidyltransferase family protein [Granulicella sp. 5B5]|uniref:nucleotidyltransferase family protein n=1 Tax=Granulicella sp. 5B5 TaxID=1617967 RepID=UPI0015F38975|nr:nucleotidyltransferase family protein [Granulicella sp. 5B5]